MSGEQKPVILDSKDKWIVAILAGILFVLFSSPLTYKFTGLILDTNISGCPTVLGILVHMILFVVVVRMILQ